ncbi:pancreatic lipase-related protein 2-like isoform X2 [Maniola hyperantus]|uniref:pancreatic lipase-related protein 2-like isoform X2 n=1 Tax=Aphantopus hyperantus TaxID=2795564 RepID=UPI002133C16A
MFRAVSVSWKKYWWGTGILPDRTNRIEDIYLRFYNGNSFEEYVDIPLHQACKLVEVKGFDNNNPTVLYIHGFIETAQQESVQVGAVTAEHLNKLIEAGLSIEKLQIVGHSLGSHVAGYLARHLKNKYSKTIKRLTALDPAFPAFYPDGVVMDHVTEKDADFVDVIHTDAGGYGAPVRTGTADFWPNGGKSVQPGCPRFAPIPLTDDNLCSHWRSWRFYAESIRNPEAFAASPADSYHKFRENQTPEVGMVYMGANCDNKARGSYYLTTNAEYPFGKGMGGIYSNNKNTRNKNHNQGR